MYHRLRDLREDAGLTQTQVAKYLGMSQTGYSKYETGENDIPTQVLIRLAQLYRTSTDYLLGLRDRRAPLPCHLPILPSPFAQGDGLFCFRGVF